MKARALLVTCCFLLPLAAAGGASGQTATEPPGGWFNLPYFHSSYGWFRIVSNPGTFGGVRISNATPLSTPYPGPTPEEGSGRVLESIWAVKCKRDVQTVTFERKVFLPGVPDVLKASLFSQTVSSYAPPPITAATLKVNGVTVLEYLKGSVPRYPNRMLVDVAARGAEFRYGENTITITARKKKTLKPHPQAGAYCQGDNRFGVGAELYGEFTADVTTTGPTPGGTSAGSSTSAVIPITITNKGPSDLFTGAGQFRFAATSNNVDVTNLYAGVDGGGNPVLQDCSQNSSHSDGRGDGRRATCPVPRLAPGQAISFNVVIGFSSFDCPSDRIHFDYATTGYYEAETTLADNGSVERGLQRMNC